MRTKYLMIFLTFIVFSTNILFANNAVISPDKGKVIFATRCTSCHNVNAKVVGPALANVDQRASTEWIVDFVHSPKTMIKKNDKYAVALYNQFNQIVMPDHSDLSPDDIKSILSYIKSETKISSSANAPFTRPGKAVPNYHPLSITKNAGFFVSYLIAVLLLVLLLLTIVTIKEKQRAS